MGIISTCPRCGGETYDYACPGCDAETMADLRESVHILTQELALTRAEVVAQTRAKEGALKEVERLKSDLELAEMCLKVDEEEADKLHLPRVPKTLGVSARFIKEINRLKQGRFTPEEFQTLCHNLSPEKLCQFRLGCVQYQSQLFGRAEVQADIARELRYALKQVAHRDGTDRLAELLAEVLMPEVSHE